ncbi:MAG TPA: hypothetical protein DDW85_03360 [Porphyromonadaceae bacterium]|nr:hypothetical protein [Porphyromonadaceae bacterium]
MRLLFITQLLSKDYGSLMIEFGITVSFWVLIILASMIDLWAGIKASKTVGNFKTNSHGLRQTGKKILEYLALMLLALFIDFGLSGLALIKDVLPFLNLFSIPVISIICFVGIIVTEGLSIKENLEISRGGKIISENAVDLLVSIIKGLDDKRAKPIIEALKKTENDDSTIKTDSDIRK